MDARYAPGMLGRAGRWVILGVVVGLSACGGTLSPIPVAVPRGDGQTVVTLAAGSDVRFWIVVDPLDSGRVRADYEIDLLQSGREVTSTHCAQEISDAAAMCKLRQVSYGNHRHLTCPLPCSARVPRSGPTVVRATLKLVGYPVVARAEPAEIIVEQ